MRTCTDRGVPCHRVIAAGGRLGGYGGSEALKRALLQAEGLFVVNGRVRRFREVRHSPGGPASPKRQSREGGPASPKRQSREGGARPAEAVADRRQRRGEGGARPAEAVADRRQRRGEGGQRK